MLINVYLYFHIVLVAEIVKHFIPRLVELHNYNSYENKAKKKENWQILNRYIKIIFASVVLLDIFFGCIILYLCYLHITDQFIIFNV